MSPCLIWSTKTVGDGGPKLHRRYLLKTMQGGIRHGRGVRIGYSKTTE